MCGEVVTVLKKKVEQMGHNISWYVKQCHIKRLDKVPPDKALQKTDCNDISHLNL